MAQLSRATREDVADVVIHRSLADHQLQGDFLVGEAGGHQLNDFQFAFREAGAGQAQIGPFSHGLRPQPSTHRERGMRTDQDPLSGLTIGRRDGFEDAFPALVIRPGGP